MERYYQGVRNSHLPVSNTFVMHLSTGETTALEPKEGSCFTKIQNCDCDGEVSTGKSINIYLDRYRESAPHTEQLVVSGL